MTKNLLLDAAILLGLAILGVIGYKLAPLLNPKTDMSPCRCRVAIRVSQPAWRRCLTGRNSSSRSNRGRFRRSSRCSCKPRFRGGDVRKVEVDFAGTDMKMGYNRPQLAAKAGRQRSDHFSGDGEPAGMHHRQAWNGKRRCSIDDRQGDRRGAVPLPQRQVKPCSRYRPRSPELASIRKPGDDSRATPCSASALPMRRKVFTFAATID
jgi:hypothetical protein